jgi:D-beta-D-heptose 7-phosphate kinase / D-beta-D-heptose 1-phosphate adenosyltransferase
MSLEPSSISGRPDFWSALFQADRKRHVLVVGDLMLDRYLTGTAGRVSQEAPVLVLRHQRESENPGGAGNVACNLAGLGLSVQVVGAAGQDANGDRVLQLLNGAGISTNGVIRCASRPTTTKSRVTSGAHQLLRIDHEDASELSPADSDQLLQRFERATNPRLVAIVLSDYAKGVVSPEVAQAAIALGKRMGIPVLVDPKGNDWTKYHGATMASPNRIELTDATGESVNDLDRLLAAGESLRRRLEIEFLAVTLGEQGIVMLDDKGMARLPSQAREVFDVSGTGDTVIATVTASLIARLNRREALELANIAAGVVVGRVGTVPITREELRAATCAASENDLRNKICDAREAARRTRTWREQGRRVVFTNGCFDLVHAGHALHLEEARRFGDRLVIGLNSDSSIRWLKGDSRPIQCQEDRAILLASMSSVDAVVIFDEPTPLDLVLAIRPDVMVKGNDYAKSAIAGAKEVESWGGQVVTLPLVEGKSTSGIIERIHAGGVGDKPASPTKQPHKY